MVSRGGMSDDVSYVLLEAPLVPRLDLSDCRPTELPVLPETAASQPSPAPQRPPHIASGHMTAPTEPRDRMPALPRAPIGTVTEVKTVVVDMRDLPKPVASPATANSTGRSSDGIHSDSSTIGDSSSDNDPTASDPQILPEGKEKKAGVLKSSEGGSSNGSEPRTRHRVSFLLDAVPEPGQEAGATQIRVFAKPPQRPQPEPQQTQEEHLQAMSQQHKALHQHRFGNMERSDGGLAGDKTLPNKRFRPHGSADSRNHTMSASYRQYLRDLQAEARLRDAYVAAASRSVENYQQRRRMEDSAGQRLLPSMTQSGTPQPGRRMPLFSFRRNCTVDSPPQQGGKDLTRTRPRYVLPQNPGIRPVKGPVRFQDEDIANASQSVAAGNEARLLSQEESEYATLHARHVDQRQTALRRENVHNGLPAETEYHHQQRIGSGKPPLPRGTSVTSSGVRANSDSGEGGGGYVRINSAGSRSSGVGRCREWLSVDTVPSAGKSRQRPSTVSSASSSVRSREISSAKQRISSSRVSSASVKAASDPGLDLDNMDLVTLNLMARRAKGPSRYRYLAKLRSLNLNTPRPLA